MENKLNVVEPVGRSDKAYDHYCKQVLQDPHVLIYFLKYFVSEYKEMPLDEILRYMERTPPTDTWFKRMSVVDESIHQARIEFDTLFLINVPKKDGTLGNLYINIEAQNEDHPGYPLIKRANYYSIRLLDRQKNHPDGFMHSDFDEMKKVYSIWICLGHPKYKDNAINIYKETEICENREYHEPKENYQLKKVIMIYLGYDKENSGPYKELLDLMVLLFRFEVPMEEKKKQLSEKYGILLDEETEKEMRNMYSFSEMTLRRGIEQGMEKGMKQGVEKGKIQTTIAYIKNVMKSSSMNEESAMDLLGVEEELRPTIMKNLLRKDE